jgi:hypothetical protein
MDNPERLRFKDHAVVAALTVFVLLTSPALVVAATVLYVATLLAFMATLFGETSRAVRSWTLGHREQS